MREADLQPRYYVYALLDTTKPGPFKYGKWVFPYMPFYVGKGKGGRAYMHLCLEAGNTHSKNRIKKIRRFGFEPKVMIKRDKLNESAAFELEKTLIGHIGRRDNGTGPLTNWTDGGEGVAGYIPTPDERESRRIRFRERFKRMSPSEIEKYHKKVAKGVKSWWDFASPKEIDAKILSMKRGLSDMPEDKKLLRIQRIVNGNKLYYDSLTDKERNRITKRKVEGMSNMMSNLTKEERSAYNNRKTIGLRTWYSKLTEEEKETYKKRWSEARKLAWSLRSPSERARIGRKQSATKTRGK